VGISGGFLSVLKGTLNDYYHEIKFPGFVFLSTTFLRKNTEAGRKKDEKRIISSFSFLVKVLLQLFLHRKCKNLD